MSSHLTQYTALVTTTILCALAQVWKTSFPSHKVKFLFKFILGANVCEASITFQNDSSWSYLPSSSLLPGHQLLLSPIFILFMKPTLKLEPWAYRANTACPWRLTWGSWELEHYHRPQRTPCWASMRVHNESIPVSSFLSEFGYFLPFLNQYYYYCHYAM